MAFTRMGLLSSGRTPEALAVQALLMACLMALETATMGTCCALVVSNLVLVASVRTLEFSTCRSSVVQMVLCPRVH